MCFVWLTLTLISEIKIEMIKKACNIVLICTILRQKIIRLSIHDDISLHWKQPISTLSILFAESDIHPPTIMHWSPMRVAARHFDLLVVM